MATPPPVDPGSHGMWQPAINTLALHWIELNTSSIVQSVEDARHDLYHPPHRPPSEPSGPSKAGSA